MGARQHMILKLMLAGRNGSKGQIFIPSDHSGEGLHPRMAVLEGIF